MFNENECSRLFTEILEFDAESFCGCPNTNPDGPGVCQLCDDGDEVLFPDLIVNDESDLSCNDIETSTRYIPSIEPCDKVRTSYAEDGTIGRCCGDPNSKKKWLQNKNGQGIGEQLQDMELLDFNKQRTGTIMVWIGIGVIICVLLILIIVFDKFFYNCGLWCCCLLKNKKNRNENVSGYYSYEKGTHSSSTDSIHSVEGLGLKESIMC